MNHKWNYQPPSQEQTEAAKALAKETGISPILCKLLLERGITLSLIHIFHHLRTADVRGVHVAVDVGFDGGVDGDDTEPVSYTHLDVYKRQAPACRNR